MLISGDIIAALVATAGGVCVIPNEREETVFLFVDLNFSAEELLSFGRPDLFKRLVINVPNRDPVGLEAGIHITIRHHTGKYMANVAWEGFNDIFVVFTHITIR